MINIQPTYGIYMMMVSKFEPWFPWKKFMFFANKLSFNIVIKCIKDLIYFNYI
jgi:hypothetical protein